MRKQHTHTKKNKHNQKRNKGRITNTTTQYNEQPYREENNTHTTHNNNTDVTYNSNITIHRQDAIKINTNKTHKNKHNTNMNRHNNNNNYSKHNNNTQIHINVIL